MNGFAVQQYKCRLIPGGSASLRHPTSVSAPIAHALRHAPSGYPESKLWTQSNTKLSAIRTKEAKSNKSRVSGPDSLLSWLDKYSTQIVLESIASVAMILGPRTNQAVFLQSGFWIVDRQQLQEICRANNKWLSHWLGDRILLGKQGVMFC